MAHTSGPWVVSTRSALGEVIEIDIKHRGRRIGSVTMRPDLPALENAALMAAAPDLSAALRGLALGSDCWCQMAIGNPMVREHSPACVAARKAVAKAEGRS